MPAVAAVLRAYRELEARAEGEDSHWYAAARRMTTLALSTALRRGGSGFVTPHSPRRPRQAFW